MSSWVWAVLVAGLVLAGWVAWRRKAARESQNVPAAAPKASPSLPPEQREKDTLYQKSRVVARVSGVRVDEAGQKLYCDEIHNSDLLVLADECEYEHYRIVIRKVEHAAKSDPTAPHKGRVLRGIEADIVGYCQP
jgi:predicted transposase YdaD